ncbi:hypothetical protein Tco_1176651 [Tanacetum coccineum]
MPRDDPIIERIPRRSLKKRNITPSKNELPHIGSNVAFEENMISRFNIGIARRTRDGRLFRLLDLLSGLENYGQTVVQSIDQNSRVNIYGNVGKALFSVEVANLVWVVEKIKFIKEKVPEEEKAEDSLKRKKCSSGDNLSSVTVPFLSYGNSGDDSQALIQESHVLVGLNRIGIDSFPVKLPYHILLENQESSYNESSQEVTPDANSIADLVLDDPLPVVAEKGEVSNGVKHVVHECLVTVILLLKT